MSAPKVYSPQPPPTIANLALLGSKIAFSAISRLISAPFRRDGSPVLFKDVFFAAIRTMLANLTISQSRYLNKSTSETYLDLCKKVNQTPKTVEIEEDGVSVKAHWIGSDDAEVVILYLHGGGYTQPCSPGHLDYIHRLVTDLNKGAKTVSVLLLAYTLVPEARFPTQLKQAAGTLSFLLSEGKRSSRNILLSGDSAGGALAISLLSHLLHPHPDVPKVGLDVPLRGLFVYSPWVSFDTGDDSYTRNESKDVLVPSMLRKWSGMYIGTVDDETDPGIVAVGDVYNEPLRADPSWWKEVHKIVGDVWFWGGDDEVFIDSLRAFGEKFRKGWTAGGGVEERVTLEFVEKDMHIGPIMDVELQYKEKSKTQLRLEQWLEERLT